jgi:predicted RND superfamily exporter protein
MKKTDQLGIESELETLIREAEIMKKKETQMEKFLNGVNPDSEFTEETGNLEKRNEEMGHVEDILLELESEKDKCPEILEFYKVFEEVRDSLAESVSSEKKLAKACKEIFTGIANKRDS